MPTHFYNRVPSSESIIYLLPRKLLRECASEMVALASAPGCPTARVRRQIADASARFGDALIEELLRLLAHTNESETEAIVLILQLTASAPARQALWGLANDSTRAAAIRLDVLRALCQLGEKVEMQALVKLANQCEKAPPRRNHDLHT